VVSEFTIAPEAVGLDRHPAEALVGGTPAENAVITRTLLQGGGTAAQRGVVAFNAGAALYLAGRADDLVGGVRLAQDILASGAAWTLLERYAAYTNG
jgi:anthranilate phosphoribosyltransferase